MHNTFGTVLAIGIIASGFLFTGDLGWCVRQVSRSLDRTGEPTTTESAEAEPVVPVVPETIGTATATVRRPPARGVDQVELTRMSAGQRIVLWTATAGRDAHCHVLHPLDPSTGEALLERCGPEGIGPARRVLVAAGSPTGAAVGTTLSRGGTLLVRPIGLAHGAGGAVETLGPIAALVVE